MKRHAQIHLPPLSAVEALRLVALLDRAITAIWRAHGPAMADEAGLHGIEVPQPPDSVYVGTPQARPDGDVDDSDIDF
jgi:hypothetical protein